MHLKLLLLCSCMLSECQKEDGTCVCEAGYTGDLCLDPCSEGSFGSHCEAACECSTLGTVSCHHVTGDCSCHANYTGSICDELIVVEAGLPAVALALPMVVILITAASITSLGIAFWRRKKKKRVAPVSNGGEGGTEGESVRGESDGESSQDNLLNMTAAKSLEVLVPKGKELKELFPQKEADEDLFQEPSQAHTKLRWQVVQVVSQEMGCVALETTHKGESDNESELFPSKVSFSFQAENQENMNEPKDKKSMEDEAQDATGGSGGLVSEGQGEDRAVMIVYRRGVYLNPDATLKDLRNSFLDSGQLEGKNRFFEFLMSDVPGDTIAIETEPETYLSKLESDFAEPRTIHFQLMDEDGHSELCVCGRYADLECSECHAQGYCSSACQTQHWAQHATSCRVVSARRRRRRRRKHRKKSHEICTILTSGCDLCPCGREVEFDCSQCDVQGYCSEQCQVKDWPRHQTLCYKRGESP